MKTIKNNDGTLSLTLSKEEIEQMIKIYSNGHTTLTLFDDKNANHWDKGLRKYVVNFFKELYEVKGNDKIYPKDKVVKDLRVKYFISDLTELLNRLNTRGFCEIKRNYDSRVPTGKIEYFILKF